MSTRAYENFDLLIEAVDHERFRVRVTQCAAGDSPALVSALPFSPVQLENVLLKLDPGRSGTRRLLDPQAQASVELGSGLFDAVFRDQVLMAWLRSNDVARSRDHGLRLRLRLVDAPSLAGLPWEFLYDRKGNRFFAQSDRTPIVRYLDVSDPPRPLVVGGPLRVLVVISSPEDLAPLEVEKEWAGIHGALAERERAGLVVVDRLPMASLAELQRWLRRHEVHVLHFVGHGDFDERRSDGVIAFTDMHGRSVPVSAAQLGAHVRDHDPLRLVVLNACRTAITDNVDAYSGMAQGLIQQEAAAVVAMQFPITDGAAIVFTNEFYGSLADGEPVDQAVTSARKAMLADFGREWATPVLFLRAPDGRIFDRIEAPPTPVSPVPTGPRPTAAAQLPAEVSEPTSSARPATRQNPTVLPSPEPPERGRPHRRWIIAAVAAVVLTAGGIVTLTSVSGAHHPRGGSSSAGPTPSSPSRPTPSPSTSSSPVGGGGNGGTATTFSILSATRAFTGPSEHTYGAGRPLTGVTRVALICALYGARADATGNPLWYYTDHGWINDHNVQTGGRDAIRSACIGNVNHPGAGGIPPSASSGPFGAVGLHPILLYPAPSSAGTSTGAVAPDTLVLIICRTSGDFVAGASGGVSSSYWDRLSDGRYIPDAFLLTGGATAPFCSSSGRPADGGGSSASGSGSPSSSSSPSSTTPSSTTPSSTASP